MRYLSFTLKIALCLYCHVGFSQGLTVVDVANLKIKKAELALKNAEATMLSTNFAKTIIKAKEQYDRTVDVYKNAMQIYNTGKEAVDIAKRIAGDVKGMSDLQSYQLMFTRLHQQELSRINSSATTLINFNQTYNSTIRKYLSPEGAINPIAIAKEYSNDPNIGYSKILVQMTNMNNQAFSYACQNYNVEATALENKANLYEKEAQYVNNLVAYTNMGVSFDKLNQTGAGLDKTFNTDAFSKSFKAVSDSVNSTAQRLIKKEMDNYAKNNGVEVTPQSTDKLMERFRGLQKEANNLREKSNKLRAKIWQDCGSREMVGSIMNQTYQQQLKGKSSSEF
jgi:hypothetical protein